MKKILILMGRYLPGYRDGGPLRTIANVVDALGDEFEFYIGCLDRDHGDTEPYRGIKIDAWNMVGKAQVWYVKPGGFTDELILRLADGKDSIYLTSFYDDYGYKTLWLKRRGKIKIPVALASMGVFSEGALAQKALMKKLFITGCKVLGLYNNITWSVTSEIEAEDLKRVIGAKARYVVAEDLPRNNVPGRKGDEYKGPLRIVFISRICAHKGLDIAIDAVKQMTNVFFFTIYGPVQEEDYWEMCQKKLEGMNCWSYKGDVTSDQVQEVLSHQDVLLLPTKSENYGHVIFEALSVGCIPVISDKTPWSIVEERQAGFTVNRTVEGFATALNKLMNMGIHSRLTMSLNAVALAQDKVQESLSDTGYRKLFNR